MWLNPFPSLWREEPARIAIPGDPVEMLARLRAKTARVLLSGRTEGFVGRVDPERVRIRSYGAVLNVPPDYVPGPYDEPRLLDSGQLLVLDARVAKDGKESALVGVYRKSHFVRVVTTIWLSLALMLLAGGLWLLTRPGSDAGAGRGLILAGSVLYFIGCSAVARDAPDWGARKQLIDRLLASGFAEPGT
jgi:hypothetical protein